MPSEQLKTVMEFEADRMTGLVLTDAVVLPERNVILEEQNQRVANNPRARLGEQIDAALFLNHPYGKPVIGWRHEMEQLTRDDAIGFYRRFYGPNNAVVVIAGDVEPQAARKLAEETYGKVARNTNHRAAPAAAGAAAGGGALAHAGRSARRAADAAARLSGAVLRHRQARRIGSAGSAGAYPRHAAPTAGSTARWWWTSTVAVSAGAWYDSSALDMSKFGVYGAPREGVTLPQLEAAIDAVIAAGDRQGRHRTRNSSAPRSG